MRERLLNLLTSIQLAGDKPASSFYAEIDLFKRDLFKSETPLHALVAQLKQVLKDASEIRSACGFMWMRMAVAKDAQDAYDVAKREFADHEDAFRRLETTLPKADELAALLLTAGPQETPVCPTCQGRRWVAKSESHDHGNGMGSGGAWNEPCPTCGTPLRDGGTVVSQLLELVEELVGWWELNRDGSVNRTYEYMDKMTKRLSAVMTDGPETPRLRDGAALIAVERFRQVMSEGWTDNHDDEHDCAQLAAAACCYVAIARRQADGTIRSRAENIGAPSGWPWEQAWWKPSDDPVRNLVKAGALIAAEIDRLVRAGAKEPEQ